MAFVDKYSFKNFMRGLLIYSQTAGDTSGLDTSIVSKDIKDIIDAEPGVSLAEPSATVIRANNKWEITDGDKKLIAYKDKGFGSPAKLRLYREDFTKEIDLTPGTVIVGSCFYRESPLGEEGDPQRHIFPETMTGIIFKRCNLDNIYIPPGNSIEDDAGIPSSHRRIRVQNDLVDWIVDSSGNPVEPVNIKAFQELGLSIDPKDIPAEPLDAPITKGMIE